MIALSEILVRDFRDEVPADRNALTTLPGGGRKTASPLRSRAISTPILPLAVLAILVLPGCKQSADLPPRPNRAPAAKVVGKAVSCIPIQIRNSRAHDDRTIDFEMAGGRIYRNTLPNACPGLGFEEAFTYETSQSQLCNVDIIHVLQRTGGMLHRGAACSLGQFVPVELAN